MAEARAAAVVGTYGQLRSKTLARSDMRVEELSPYVRDVGVTSFGSIAAFEAILNQTRMQRLVTLDGALTLTLASHKGDTLVQHLSRLRQLSVECKVNTRYSRWEKSI